MGWGGVGRARLWLDGVGLGFWCGVGDGLYPRASLPLPVRGRYRGVPPPPGEISYIAPGVGRVYFL